jgi:hypothetical protein
MLPFHMLAALPVQPSPRLALLRDLCALCVKIPTKSHRRISPCLTAAQSLPSFSTPSKHRARTNARKPFPLYRLLHNFRTPRRWGLHSLSRAPLSPHAMSHACPCPVHNSFKRNAYKNKRGPRASYQRAIRYSLLTTHYSLSSTIRYTIPSRHT